MNMGELYQKAKTRSIDEGQYKLWSPVSKHDQDMQLLYCKFQYLFQEGGLGEITDYTDFFELKSIKENRAIA